MTHQIVETQEAAQFAGVNEPSGDSPSDGSKLHGTLNEDGQPACTPCAWFHKEGGCLNEKNCRRCHLCPKGELKNRRKAKIARTRSAEAVAAAEKADADDDDEDGSSSPTGRSGLSTFPEDVGLGRFASAPATVADNEHISEQKPIARGKSGPLKAKREQAPLSLSACVPPGHLVDPGMVGAGMAGYPPPFDPMMNAWGAANPWAAEQWRHHQAAMNSFSGFPPAFPGMPPMGMPPSPGGLPLSMPPLIPPSPTGYPLGLPFPAMTPLGGMQFPPHEKPPIIREDGFPSVPPPPESPQNIDGTQAVGDGLPTISIVPAAVSSDATADTDVARPPSDPPPGLPGFDTCMRNPSTVSAVSAISEALAETDDLERVMTSSVKTETTEGGVCQILWTVDAKKLKASDKVAVSPSFQVPWIPSDTDNFRMMLHPAVVNDGRGGASFKKAKGRAVVKLKCEQSLEAENAVVNIRIAVFPSSTEPDSDEPEPPRGPVTHDFSQGGICGLPSGQDEWDFKAITGGASSFIVCLQLLPPGQDVWDVKPPPMPELKRAKSEPNPDGHAHVSLGSSGPPGLDHPIVHPLAGPLFSSWNVAATPYEMDPNSYPFEPGMGYSPAAPLASTAKSVPVVPLSPPVPPPPGKPAALIEERALDLPPPPPFIPGAMVAPAEPGPPPGLAPPADLRTASAASPGLSADVNAVEEEGIADESIRDATQAKEADKGCRQN